MENENETGVETVNDVNGDSQTEQETEIDYKALYEDSQSKLQKQIKIKQDVTKDRDNLKKNQTQKEENDYKKLYEDELTARQSIETRVKTANAKAAVSAQLTKIGVRPEFHDAALKLIDMSKVEVDDDGDVDPVSVTAVGQQFKKDYAVMCEKVINKVDAKGAVNGSADNKTITRDEFNSLSTSNPIEASKRMREGWKIV